MSDMLFRLFAVVLIVATIFIVSFALWDALVAETFTLRKDQWECTEWRTTTTIIPAGKVMVPTVNRECQVWERVR